MPVANPVRQRGPRLEIPLLRLFGKAHGRSDGLPSPPRLRAVLCRFQGASPRRWRPRTWKRPQRLRLSNGRDPVPLLKFPAGTAPAFHPSGGIDVMQHRSYSFFPSAPAAVLLVAAFACAKEPGAIERKSESTTKTTQGEVKTTQESKQVGNTLEAKTETKTDTGAGTVKGKVETY